MYRELRLRALEESPDAFSSTRAREIARPDIEWERRLAAGVHSPTDLPLVALVGAEAIALAWGRVDPSEPTAVHLYQVWVAPEYRGRGVGRRLLDAVITWARDVGAREVALEVTDGDSPARRLYARAGFRPAGEPQPLRPGSSLMQQPMRLDLGRTSDLPAV